MDEYLSTKQVAEMMGISDRTVRTLCREKKLKHEKIGVGRNLRFKKSWVDEYMTKNVVEVETEEKQN